MCRQIKKVTLDRVSQSKAAEIGTSEHILFPWFGIYAMMLRYVFLGQEHVASAQWPVGVG